MTSSAALDLFSPGQLHILDGGFGTTLEDVFKQNITQTPLWSAKLIRENPDVVIQTHKAFLDSGAEIVLTSTYQCSYRTFAAAGYSTIDAQQIMLEAVYLAEEARKRHLSTHPDTKAKIALSLGSFGAAVQPAQEFSGFYPPPYGPAAHDDNNRNVFTEEENQRGLGQGAIDALALFHLERLRVFACSEQAWGMIDAVAFETVPLINEIIAIRLAVEQLQEEMLESNAPWSMRPWWISLVFPDGSFPQKTLPDGSHADLRTILDAVLASGGAKPSALGINCTPLETLPNLTRDIEAVLSSSNSEFPGLVLYPNGGGTYDTVTQIWSEGSKGDWVDGHSGLIKEVVERGHWQGVIAGGCCKTTPADIGALRKRLKASIV